MQKVGLKTFRATSTTHEIVAAISAHIQCIALTTCIAQTLKWSSMRILLSVNLPPYQGHG